MPETRWEHVADPPDELDDKAEELSAGAPGVTGMTGEVGTYPKVEGTTAMQGLQQSDLFGKEIDEMSSRVTVQNAEADQASANRWQSGDGRHQNVRRTKNVLRTE